MRYCLGRLYRIYYPADQVSVQGEMEAPSGGNDLVSDKGVDSDIDRNALLMGVCFLPLFTRRVCVTVVTEH